MSREDARTIRHPHDVDAHVHTTKSRLVERGTENRLPTVRRRRPRWRSWRWRSSCPRIRTPRADEMQRCARRAGRRGRVSATTARRKITRTTQNSDPDLVVVSHAAWKRRNFRRGTEFAAAVTPRRALGSPPRTRTPRCSPRVAHDRRRASTDALRALRNLPRPSRGVELDRAGIPPPEPRTPVRR